MDSKSALNAALVPLKLLRLVDHIGLLVRSELTILLARDIGFDHKFLHNGKRERDALIEDFGDKVLPRQRLL